MSLRGEPMKNSQTKKKTKQLIINHLVFFSTRTRARTGMGRPNGV